MIRGLKSYLLYAIGICFTCTFIISYNCSCNREGTAPNMDRSRTERGIVREDKPFGIIPSADLPETYLLVVIMSSPQDSLVRKAIRNTWMKLTKKGPDVVRYIFPIGLKNIAQNVSDELTREQNTFGDLAFIEDLEESYSKLASKTLKSCSYAFRNYRFKHILKVDSDSFVRIGALLKSLRDIDHPRLYWGFLDGRAKPIRKGKWKESDWVICDRFLPYQLGGGYTLSYELVRYLAMNAQLFKIYKSEDVSVGAWLAGLDVKYVHDPRFDTEWQSRGCHNEYLITHKKSPNDMSVLYENLVKGSLCGEKEYRHRYSYVYNWAVPPSQCCDRKSGTRIP